MALALPQPTLEDTGNPQLQLSSEAVMGDARPRDMSIGICVHCILLARHFREPRVYLSVDRIMPLK